MAKMQMEHESSISAEKLCTSYKWSLRDWSLLYDIYYSTGDVTSPKFPLAGTGGCMCHLKLPRNDPHYPERNINVTLSDDPNFEVLEITISLIDEKMNKLVTFTSGRKSFAESFDVQLPVHLKKTGLEGYLSNNTLTLFVEFVMVKSITSSQLHSESSDKNIGINIRNNLESLLNSETLSDITFVIGNERLMAHKVILAANSDVFKAMFISEMREKESDEMNIVDTDANVFKEFLNYLYTGKISNLETIVNELIVVADQYQIQDLKILCEEYMSAHLDDENVMRYVLTADKLCCTLLKTKAINFLNANKKVFANVANYEMLLDYPTLVQEIFGK